MEINNLPKVTEQVCIGTSALESTSFTTRLYCFSLYQQLRFPVTCLRLHLLGVSI